MTDRMFSVIIPAYNAEKSIGTTLKSVLNQTYRKFEVIVVNDGSVDSTEDVVKVLSSDDNRIKLISVSNGGSNRARQIGVSHAVGEWIIFVDADDCIPENALLTYRNAMGGDIGLIVGNHHYRGSIRSQSDLSAMDWRRMIVYPRLVSGALWGKCFRREFVDSEYFRMDRDIDHREDLLVNIRIAMNLTGVVRLIPDKVYEYRFSANGLAMRYHPSPEYEAKIFGLFRDAVSGSEDDMLDKLMTVNQIVSCIALMHSTLRSVAPIKKSDFYKDTLKHSKELPAGFCGDASLLQDYPYFRRCLRVMTNRVACVIKMMVKLMMNKI